MHRLQSAQRNATVANVRPSTVVDTEGSCSMVAIVLVAGKQKSTARALCSSPDKNSGDIVYQLPLCHHTLHEGVPPQTKIMEVAGTYRRLLTEAGIDWEFVRNSEVAHTAELF